MKTSGICTVSKEEGGTARPGESKERKVFIAESRKGKEQRVGARNVQRSTFLICTSRRVSYCSANDRLRPSRMARAIISFTSFVRWRCIACPLSASSINSASGMFALINLLFSGFTIWSTSPVIMTTLGISLEISLSLSPVTLCVSPAAICEITPMNGCGRAVQYRLKKP